ncbi:MAG: DNA-3-methyladenine glycosylase 2 family protein, partial [Gaiellales bacterium]
MEPAVITTLRPRTAVDIGRTLAPLRRGPHDPTCRVEAGAWWRATRTPLGPASLRIAGLADATIRIDAWGPGAEAAVDAAPRLCGLDDDVSSFRPEGLLGELHRRNPGLRLCATGRIFELLVPTVLEQRVSGLEAYRSWRRLVRGMSERAPGPLELWLPP